MKIEKFKKRPNGLYTIYLDNFNTYDFYEEIILKYELLITKTLTEAELKKIIDDNKKYESYYEALKVLKKVPKSKEEIKKLLQAKNYSKENISFTLNNLEKQGYLNDKNYAKSYVHNNLITTNKGPKKIEQELITKGINSNDYLEALEEYTPLLEKEKIEKLISKKINSNHTKSSKVLKQKLGLYLINNGFHQDVISEVLNSTTIEDNDLILKKEYQKYYNKLSKKYRGKELEYRLKQKMYSLGFDISKDN